MQAADEVASITPTEGCNAPTEGCDAGHPVWPASDVESLPERDEGGSMPSYVVDQSEEVHSAAHSEASCIEASWQLRASSTLKVSDPSLLRGTQLAKCLRSFGRVLSDQPATMEYYQLSSPVAGVHTFVSHNWSTPRWKKFLVLVFHFNIGVACLVSLLAAAFACGLTAAGLLPHTLAVGHATGEGVEYLQGFCCLPVGLVALFTCLFTWHELDRLLMPLKRTVFFDKTCVHQVDQELKRKGIESLAAVLCHSKNILILYSDVYMRKLWTIYEATSWLMLHQGDGMIVRPVWAPIMVLSACLCFSLTETLLLAANIADVSVVIPPVTGFCIILSCVTPPTTILAWLVAKWATERERIQSHVAKFSLADAQCASEADRFMVMQNIVAFMKTAKHCEPDAESEQVFRTFEELVRVEVPKLMAHSFGRVGLPYHWALIAGLPHGFVALDYLAGDWLAAKSIGQIALWFAFHITPMLAIGPLILAFMARVMKSGCFRSIPGCISVGVVGSTILASYLSIAFLLTCKAEQSNEWLALLVLAYAAAAAAVALTYRPLARLTPGGALKL